MDEINRSVANSQLKNLADFIKFYNFLGADGKAMTTTELLNYKSKKFNKTNRELIRGSYEIALLKGVLTPAVGKEEDLILPYSPISIPAYAYQRDFVRVETNSIQDFKQTKNKLLSNVGKFSSIATFDFGGMANRYKKSITTVSVWIWCRALGDFPNGKLIDVSKFVKSVTTNVADNGGNFSLTFGAMTCSYINGVIKPVFNEYIENGRRQVNVKSSTLRQTTEGTKRSLFYLHHIIRPNDLVFISFDDIDKSDITEIGDLEISMDELAKSTNVRVLNDSDVISEKDVVFTDLLGNKYRISSGDRRWDMIGLVDVNTQSFSSAPSLSITITGRDLFKVFIDDQEKFFPLEYAGVDIYGIFNNLKNKGAKQNRAKRRLDGELAAINVFVDNTIEECLVFILSHLSHIEIAPDSVFASWGDSRSVYKYPVSVENVNQEGKDKAGNKVNTSFKRVTGFEEDIGAGIWAIIKILVDDNNDTNSLKTRRLVDSSIRTEQGSIINYINRVCQPPFVEFWGDTIRNQYYLNVRTPPFYEQAVKENIAIFDEVDRITNESFHLREFNIKNETLSFDASDVYSWYRINPTGNFLGDSSTFVNAYLPAIFFPEYAEIYGARALEVTSNYIDYSGTIRGSNQSQNLNFLQQQAVNDLRFLVETNSYLPFVRKGSISIDLDYRYKKGMFIRNLGTDEVFYIDSVQHQYKISNSGVIQNSTTLSVSRGMVDKVQKGGIRTLDLYFMLIDYADNLNKTAKNYVLINWSVNRVVFEYFLRGLQFADDLPPEIEEKLKKIIFKPI